MTNGSQCVRAPVSIAAFPRWTETLGETLSPGVEDPHRALPFPYTDRCHLACSEPTSIMSIFVALIPSEFSIL